MFIKPALAFSLKDSYSPAKNLSNPTLGGIAGPIINNVIIFSGLFAFFVIIFAGFNYISGAGDKQKMTQAQTMLTNGILGLVIVVASYLITNIVFNLVGYQLF